MRNVSLLVFCCCIFILSQGCSSTMEITQPLDIRNFKIESIKKEQEPLRLVIGIKDFEGLFSEQYRSDEFLTTEERKRWRDMGVKVFPDAIAAYLRKRNIVLDATRTRIEAVDVVLEGTLHEFRNDLCFSSTIVYAMYAPVNFDTWRMTSKINAEFRLVTPLGKELAKFTIVKEMPEFTEKRQRVYQQFSPTKLPPDVEAKADKLCRNFFRTVLEEIGSKIVEHSSKFEFLQRPDFSKAQNLSEELLTGKPRNQWAVVIGISRYMRGGEIFPDLQFAHRDASEFCNFLMSPEGGGFKKDRILLLTDMEANYAAIRRAFFTFLKDAQPEDLVIIYFSGHGAPDPDRPNNLYLIPCDVDPQNIAGSALPMWDIEKVLWKTVEAQRVIVFIDACHSAGATLNEEYGSKGINKRMNIYDHYFRRLSHIRPGRVVFSSSNGYEQSLESNRWGNGHGVFTWALLEALKGKADGYIPGTRKDNIISLQEVIRYVTHKVEEETKGKQHPFLSASPKYDPELPLAVVPNNMKTLKRNPL